MGLRSLRKREGSSSSVVMLKAVTGDAEQETQPESARKTMDLASNGPFIADCIDARHPTLSGRVCVRFQRAGVVSERWLPTLRHVVVREMDRVLVTTLENEAEPIVIGVIDGFTRRAEPPRTPGPRVELQDDEVLTVTTSSGEQLLEIVQNEQGPVIRLLQSDTQLELPGKLQIKASEIELQAARGGVRIEASDDVVVQGEMIHLN